MTDPANTLVHIVSVACTLHTTRGTVWEAECKDHAAACLRESGLSHNTKRLVGVFVTFLEKCIHRLTAVSSVILLIVSCGGAFVTCSSCCGHLSYNANVGSTWDKTSAQS